jgi:hypothetical protein
LFTFAVSVRVSGAFLVLGPILLLWFASQLFGWGEPGRFAAHAPLPAKLVMVPFIAAGVIYWGYRLLFAGL